MKKIILLFVLTLLTIINSDIKAITNEQLLINAAKATIEKARTNGTGLFFNSNSEIKITQDSYSPKTTEEKYIAYTLSNMRAQAELYYSNNDNYGKTTQSCYVGMFSSKDQGLSNQLTEILKKTSVVNCSSNTKSWAVSAKISNGKYWCVDSSGYSKSIGAILKKGGTACDKGVKYKGTVETSTVNTSFSLFPKLGKIYDILYKTNLTTPTTKYDSSIISKDDVSYELITNNSIDVASIGNKASVGKYLIIPNNKSMLAQYESLNGDKIDKVINSILSLKFTARLIKANTDGGVYEVTFPYIDFIHSISPIYSKLNLLTTDLYYFISDSSRALKMNIVVKNGLISSIYGYGNMKSDAMNMNSAITITGNVRQGPVVSINNLNTVTCEQLFGQNDNSKSICTPNYVERNTDVLIPEPATPEQSKKAIDATIQATLSNMRSQAELYYSNNNNYGIMTSSCFSGMFGSTATGGLSNLVSTVQGRTNDVVCNATIPGPDNRATAWLVSAKLNTGPWFCVDSTGNAVTNNMQKSGADTKCK